MSLNNWQPIETVPKDGTKVIACRKSKNEIGVVRWSKHHEMWENSWFFLENFDPDFWHPLPDLPMTKRIKK